jgi:1-phosphatidylinositol phosphodiesterase
MANITIRNVTIHPLELVSIERFESKREDTGNLLSNVTGTISSFLNATEHQSHQTVAGDSRHKEDVNVCVDPFKTKQTDFRTADPGREVIRLVFKTEDHKYEVDVPSPNKKSSTMKKLDGGPHELTAVYVSTGAFIAVYSSAKLESWMKELHNDWPLTVLSIPGTHNSPTCYTALPSVRCQSVGVPEQLQNGVRFLDIRVSAEPDNDTLTLVHSVFPISLTGSKYFGDMCNDIYEFLEKYPSETVIMSVKREGSGKGTDQQMSKYFKHSYVDKKRDRWWTEPKIPTLGQARGRIVIMRRYALDDELRKQCWDGRGYGIDAQHWPDNCEDGKIGNGEQVRVQDFYEVTESQNVEKKIDFSRGQLERAAEQLFELGKGGDRHPPFFVNFLSASNFFNASCWPERIAAKVNPAIVEYLCIRHGEEGKGPKKLRIGSAGTGVVVTDWVGANDDWDLIRCIVGMNARLQIKR